MILRGDHVVFQVQEAGSWTTLGCAKSVTLTVNTGVIETAVTGNGIFASFLPSKVSFSGTLDGLVSLDPSKLSLSYLRQMQLQQTIARVRYRRKNSDGEYTESADVFITSSEDVTNFPGLASFTVSFQGTGELKIEENIPVPDPQITYNYGWAELDTTVGEPDQNEYILSIEEAIQNGNYNVGSATKNQDVVVSFDNPSSNKVRFLKIGTDANDFNFWSEVGQPFQQNIPIDASFWRQVRNVNGLYLFTAWQTYFSGQIKFSR